MLFLTCRKRLFLICLLFTAVLFSIGENFSSEESGEELIAPNAPKKIKRADLVRTNAKYGRALGNPFQAEFLKDNLIKSLRNPNSKIAKGKLFSKISELKNKHHPILINCDLCQALKLTQNVEILCYYLNLISLENTSDYSKKLFLYILNSMKDVFSTSDWDRLYNIFQGSHKLEGEKLMILSLFCNLTFLKKYVAKTESKSFLLNNYSKLSKIMLEFNDKISEESIQVFRYLLLKSKNSLDSIECLDDCYRIKEFHRCILEKKFRYLLKYLRDHNIIVPRDIKKFIYYKYLVLELKEY